EKPEERTDFTHNPLLPWVYAHRPRLAVAALTLVKAYFASGCPSQGIKPMGSFEAWSDLVRQSLIWAGEADPNEGRKNIEAESNSQYEALTVLLDAWEQCYDRKAMTLKQTIEDIDLGATPRPDVNNPSNKWNALADALSSFDTHYDGKRLDTTRIGNALR